VSGSSSSIPVTPRILGEVDYRDPEVMRTHGYHWFDLAQMNMSLTQTRSAEARCYTISSTSHRGDTQQPGKVDDAGGMFEAKPRSRE